LQLLKFQQSDSFVGGHLRSADPVCAGWSALQIAGIEVNLVLTLKVPQLVIIPSMPSREPGTSPML